ncbi:helix-hairpin-helix domain-containing protein [Rhodoferax saidenbachensis]|uniref:Competence protein ComEA n=1 Tax=Rhodoferax saidenbachensis TaxID=1484693 RepID=A0ABU1ZLX1_9BURK|nr:helix-hairpin-helix domain-containing protein [Rhodoferax saidenbachensis]MDR7306523.1 competence protein ComEA [Rhodoferax saidenbachensis]
MAYARSLALLAAGLLLNLSSWALEVNDATEAQLDGVRGLGPSQTARILQAREIGPFKSWADFMARVKGIKASSATKLSAQGLTVGGAPYPGVTP